MIATHRVVPIVAIKDSDVAPEAEVGINARARWNDYAGLDVRGEDGGHPGQ